MTVSFQYQIYSWSHFPYFLCSFQLLLSNVSFLLEYRVRQRWKPFFFITMLFSFMLFGQIFLLTINYVCFCFLFYLFGCLQVYSFLKKALSVIIPYDIHYQFAVFINSLTPDFPHVSHAWPHFFFFLPTLVLKYAIRSVFTVSLGLKSVLSSYNAFISSLERRWCECQDYFESVSFGSSENCQSYYI